MIVKILYQDYWVFYDDFEMVRYNHFDELDAYGHKAELPESDSEWIDQYKGKHDYVHVKARRRKTGQKIGEKFTILANNIVYLCNDEGKTIERIN